jgi:ribosomal protein S18 acetylase RimI-like enzyme
MRVPEVWVATEDEVEIVAELMAEFRDHMGRSEPPLNQMRAAARRIQSDPNAEYLLAAPDGDDRPAGVCQLRFRLSIWTAAEDCWLEELYGAARARRAGLGKVLVGAAIMSAMARDCRRIELDVDDDNAPAIALYEAMGFSSESKPPGRNLLMGARLP